MILLGPPVEYTEVAKLDKRNATVHCVTAFANTLVSRFVWCWSLTNDTPEAGGDNYHLSLAGAFPKLTESCYESQTRYHDNIYIIIPHNECTVNLRRANWWDLWQTVEVEASVPPKHQLEWWLLLVQSELRFSQAIWLGSDRPRGLLHWPQKSCICGTINP